MQVIAGQAKSQTFYKTLNRTVSSSGQRIRKVKKKLKTKQYDFDEGDEEDGYEKVITKTEIKIVKKKNNKGKGRGRYAEEEEEEFEYEDAENGPELQLTSGVYSLYLSGGVQVTHQTPKPASCMTWNGNKVKTFDGLMYTHNLYCSHTLVQDIVDGSFSVVLRSCAAEATVHCSYALEIFLQNLKYTLENKSKNKQFFFMIRQNSFENKKQSLFQMVLFVCPLLIRSCQFRPSY